MRLKSNLAYLIFPLFLLTLILMQWTTLSAHDLGWHLKAGEWIIHHHDIPKSDPFNRLTPAALWIDLHWIFQILAYTVTAWGGLLGLNLMKSILLSLLFFILYRQRKISALSSCILLLLTAIACQERFQFRPELFTFLFILLDLLILESDLEKRSRKLWLIPLIQTLWSNMEGLFMIGPILIACFLFGQIFEKKDPRRFLILFVLTLVTCFINPYGYRGFIFPVTLLYEILHKGTSASSLIGELISPLSISTHTLSYDAYILITGLSLATCIIKRKCMRLSHQILLMLFFLLSLMVQRNIALFALVATWIILKSWTETESSRHFLLKGAGIAGYTAICLILIIFSLNNGLYYRDARLERNGLGIAPEIYPREAIQFLMNNHAGNHIFNTIDYGPAIIYEGWPQLTPFIDTRLEIYGEKRLNEYRECLQDFSRLITLAENDQIRYILLDHIKRDSLNRISDLVKSAQWTLAYFDATSCIFKRREGTETVNTIDGRKTTQYLNSFYSRLETWLPWLPAQVFIPSHHLYLGRFFLAIGNIREARREYFKALTLNPKISEAWINLAFLEENREKWISAMNDLNIAVKIDPDSYQAHFNLGNLFVKLRRYNEAVSEYKKAVRINPTVQAKHNLEAAQAMTAG